MTPVVPAGQVVLLGTALGLYGAALLATLARPRLGRGLLLVAVAAHLAAMVQRGVLLGFFPLTNKMESFSTAALGLGLVALLAWRRERLFTVPLLALAAAALAVAFRFGLHLTPPPPLMRTIWYPLHVPLAFVAYGLFAAAASAGLVALRTRSDEWLRRVDALALQGFGLWSLSMICGGVWGVVAWGSYFLWDVKVLWSVILWFHYATFVHVRLTPALAGRAWVRPALALVGFVFVLIAYVGTSFFFGRSSHAF